VDDADGVGRGERLADLIAEGDGLARDEAPAAAEALVEALAVEVLHRDVRAPLEDAGVEDADDVGVIQPSREADLVEEEIQQALLRGEVRMDALEHDLREGVPLGERLREPHLRHAPDAELPLEAVLAKGVVGAELALHAPTLQHGDGPGPGGAGLAPGRPGRSVRRKRPVSRRGRVSDTRRGPGGGELASGGRTLRVLSVPLRYPGLQDFGEQRGQRHAAPLGFGAEHLRALRLEPVAAHLDDARAGLALAAEGTQRALLAKLAAVALAVSLRVDGATAVGEAAGSGAGGVLVRGRHGARWAYAPLPSSAMAPDLLHGGGSVDVERDFGRATAVEVVAMSDSTHDKPLPRHSPEKLRKIRKQELGLSMEKLAAKLGYDYSTVWRYENGKTPITDEFLRNFERLRAQERAQRAGEEVDFGSASLSPGHVLVELVPVRALLGRLTRIFAAVPKEFLSGSGGEEKPDEPKPEGDAGKASARSAKWTPQVERRAIAALTLMVLVGGVLVLRSEIRTALRVHSEFRSARVVPKGETHAGAANKPQHPPPSAEKSEPAQKLAPCDLAHGEIEEGGMCWGKLENMQPPCPAYAAESKRRCLMPIPAPKPPSRPSAENPKPQGARAERNQP